MNTPSFFQGVQAPGWRVALLVAAAWLVPGAARAANDASGPLRQVTCTFAGMVDDVRGALKTGSPALKRYVRARLKEAALAMPPEELRAAVAGERDPEVLEVLGAALATKASFAEDPTLIQPLLSRATRDGQPEARAAAVRGLRGIGSVEALAKAGQGISYEQLVRDASPEVRQAVAGNLVFESDEVYSGHSRAVSEAAVSTALASPDPEVAARLLREVSMEQVGSEAVGKLLEPLRSDNPKLRASAASALGGVPGAESPRAREALVELYRTEKDPAVRKAALEGIARLGQAGSRPVLESLRGVHPGMDPEVDAWLQALGTGLQEWHLLLREKQRLRK